MRIILVRHNSREILSYVRRGNPLSFLVCIKLTHPSGVVVVLFPSDKEDTCIRIAIHIQTVSGKKPNLCSMCMYTDSFVKVKKHMT